MQTSDAEDALSDWLDDHDLRAGWEIAPTLVAAGVDTEWLDGAAETMPPEYLDGGLRWVAYTLETELLMNEIEDATHRISALVGAAKQYSQLDRAAHQEIDVRDGLDSTLVMLGGKLHGKDITVVKEYAAGLPDIPAYPAELNQVWTNLIDNAISAMEGSGTLTLRTAWTATTCSSRSATPDRACRGRTSSGSSSRSSPPSRSARAPGSAWTSPIASSCNGIGETCGSSPSPGDTRFQVRLPINEPAADPA